MNLRKSAAALTVSAFAGGLLWVASRKRSMKLTRKTIRFATRPLIWPFRHQIWPGLHYTYVCRTPSPSASYPAILCLIAQVLQSG